MPVDLVRTLSVLALIAGLLLAPIEARLDVDRGLGADVVGDQEAYLAVATLSPTLNATNNYEDDAVTVTNNNADGTSLEVTVTSDDARFEVTGGSFTLSAGASDTARISDTSTDHATGTYSVDITVTGQVWSSGSELGQQQLTRTITVEVT